MSDIQQLSIRLKHLRLSHGLTQEEFAALAGFSYKFYQQIESGKKKQIWLETVERLASAYNLQTWELLGPDLPPTTELMGKVAESQVHYQTKRKRRVPRRLPRNEQPEPE